jgi:putative hemolysin
VLGEREPKSLALRAGETYALLIGPPLASLAWLARPAVSLLTFSSNLVLRLFGGRTTFTEARLSRDENQQIVEEASSTGSVDPHADEIASRARDFSGLNVYTVMVPRSDLVMLPVDAPTARVAELARRSGHARVPVHEGSPDPIIGFVNLREVLAEAVLSETVNLTNLLHPVLFVPDAMPSPSPSPSASSSTSRAPSSVSSCPRATSPPWPASGGRWPAPCRPRAPSSPPKRASPWRSSTPPPRRIKRLRVSRPKTA